MALTPEEKHKRMRQRMLTTAAKVQTSTYLRKTVAPVFQRMIRAEAAAKPEEWEPSIVDGELRAVWRAVGECVCVTCGKVDAWDGGLAASHTGHFISSRRNSILLQESNVAPQCSRCNRYLSGNPQAFRQWMLAVRGSEAVKRLEWLKTQSISFTREELVDWLISYRQRLKIAVDSMKDVSGEH